MAGAEKMCDLISAFLRSGGVDQGWYEGDLGDSRARDYQQCTVIRHTQWSQHMDAEHKRSAPGRPRDVYVPSQYGSHEKPGMYIIMPADRN